MFGRLKKGNYCNRYLDINGQNVEKWKCKKISLHFVKGSSILLQSTSLSSCRQYNYWPMRLAEMRYNQNFAHRLQEF